MKLFLCHIKIKDEDDEEVSEELTEEIKDDIINNYFEHHPNEDDFEDIENYYNGLLYKGIYVYKFPGYEIQRVSKYDKYKNITFFIYMQFRDDSKEIHVIKNGIGKVAPSFIGYLRQNIDKDLFNELEKQYDIYMERLLKGNANKIPGNFLIKI